MTFSPLPSTAPDANLNSGSRQGTDQGLRVCPCLSFSMPRFPEEAYAMMQKYVRTPQELGYPDFVMPPRPTCGPAAGSSSSQICPLNCLTRYSPATHISLRFFTPRAATKSSNPNLAPNAPAIQHPFDTCVSYDSATTTLQILHLSDTNQFTPDTRSVECPYLRVAANPPNIPPSKYDEIRQHRSATGISSHPPLPRHPGLNRQLRPSYDHETNETPPRYEDKSLQLRRASHALSGA